MDKLKVGDVVAHARYDEIGVVVYTYNSSREGFMSKIWWVESRTIVAYNQDEVEQKIDKTGKNFANELRDLIKKITGER